ncbi:Vms1/Ankzf1 family peptidyl-tRNA hydrolase [Nocardia carnea]|uniref:Rv2629 family ribosome hibernation factor n=1 Tax=Nocardia carnea TaxID=37328 RepID=UPI0024575885|nr:Vms1/Ankzf1 family peptidyl-tRNA hydrolase [Nocardia carnea]
MSIREIAQRPGPFASLYIDAEHDTEDAEQQRALRWRALAERLEAAGATDRMIEALAAAVTGSPPEPGRAGRALIADSERVLIDRRLPHPVQPEIVRVSPLPYLLPLIEYETEEVAHAVAVVDKVGSEMYGVDDDGNVVGETIEGEGHPIHKVRHGGGWSHLSMQRRVEEKVRRNAADVATELKRLAERIRARVVVLAGDVTARAEVRRALGTLPAQVVEVESGGRAAGTDTGEFDAEVRELVAAEARQRRAETVARFDKARGRDDGPAVAGLSATVSALLAANTENLLINAAALGDRTVRLDPEPVRDPGALGALTDNPEHTCRADEALPVGVLVRGGTITPVDEEAAPSEGVGALLRHT